ncbi:solute:sodium symporter family transporter [Algisphaera agarilytica]|uniref:SSS family solute:Na+ symporter n=1 Tax=Algisphaera agarilytica TaxID=1385975 RepID=A0A7X0LJR9_9BACT|nr:solute:sodium symporter family transporter [Algisphaera agarilytica]MBB6429137.1 SSS family solute:Na+ symporter [Algisphaera agarilytica]
MTLISFLFFTAFVAAITFVLTRKDDHGTSAGYFLGGRQLGGIVIAGSLLLTNLSTEQMVGLNGAAFTDGLAVMVWEVVAVLALVCMALFFLPRFLRSGIATVPQFLEARFDAGTRTFTDLIFLAAYAVILLPIVLYTGATGLVDIISVKALIGLEASQATVSLLGAELDADTFVLWLTVWVVGIIGSCYALFGGLRTVAVSDTINGIGLLVGGLLITVFGLAAISHTLGDGSGVLDGWSTMKANGVEDKTFNSIGTSDTSVPFSTIFTGIALLNLFYWCTNQQIIQRTFGAKSLKEGQKGVLICALLKLLGPLYLVLPGIMAYVLYSDDIGFKADKAYGTLVGDVLPPYLAGFFAAVLVGAILSSFNSALNATCTLFSLGIYKNFINKQADEQQTVRSGKTVGWIIAVVAMLLAPMLAQTSSIFGYLQTMNAIYFIPILAVVLVGMLTKRVPGKAANIALVVGIVSLMLGYWVPIGEKQSEGTFVVPIAQKAEEYAKWESDPLVVSGKVSVTFLEELTIERRVVKTGFSEQAPAEPPESVTYAQFAKTQTVAKTFAPDVMHPFHFMGLVFGCLIVLMLAIGKISPRPEAWVHEHSGDVELTPWKGAKTMAVVLVILVIAIYASFAEFAT